MKTDQPERLPKRIDLFDMEKLFDPFRSMKSVVRKTNKKKCKKNVEIEFKR